MACATWVVATTTSLVLFAQQPVEGEQPPPAPTPQEIETWIAELDDNRYLVRERATQQLLDSGEAALDAVLAAANGERPEPADRAIWILHRLGQSSDNELAIAALERLVQLRDRPDIVEKAELHLAERAIIACRERLAPLGAEISVKYEPVEIGNVVPMLEVRLGPDWQGSTDDLRHVANLRQQLYFRLEGAAVDDAAVKLFADREKLAHLQLWNTNVMPAAIDALKRRHPQVVVFMRNDALLGVRAENHERGALVHNVERGTGAAAAGILPGDIITSLDGQPLPDFDRLTVRIAQHRPGDTIDLEVLRGEERKKLSATLSRRTD